MMSIALRFIPILLEETDKIMKAQIARGGRSGEWKYHSESKGHDSDSGSVVRIGISAVPMILPWQWRRAVTEAEKGVPR